ncbi:hypothetical protein [Marinobacter sp.]|uniref:hypothetical protein n=1 Tax=Marinobacter sp. TaxID=50741 RepID=UPI003566FEB6
MKALSHEIRIPTYKALISIFVVLFLIALLGFWLLDINPDSSKDVKLATILGGVCVGLGVATIQLLVTIIEQKKISFYEGLQIYDVLEDRDNKALYQRLIDQSDRVIDVMGSTCSRLMDDFGQLGNEGSNALVKAMERSVKVRLLISNPESANNAADRAAILTKTLPAARMLKEQFPDNFQLKLLKERPSHNVMLCDDVCLVGPIFDQLKSKDTPALKTHKTSILSRVYLRNFEAEWQRSEDIG